MAQRLPCSMGKPGTGISQTPRAESAPRSTTGSCSANLVFTNPRRWELRRPARIVNRF